MVGGKKICGCPEQFAGNSPTPSGLDLKFEASRQVNRSLMCRLHHDIYHRNILYDCSVPETRAAAIR